jgi:hypothetical protein
MNAMAHAAEKRPRDLVLMRTRIKPAIEQA